MMDPHYWTTGLKMLMAVIPERSCIDLNKYFLRFASSLVQLCSTGATHLQPPERLDLTVSANDVMLCSVSDPETWRRRCSVTLRGPLYGRL